MFHEVRDESSIPDEVRGSFSTGSLQCARDHCRTKRAGSFDGVISTYSSWILVSVWFYINNKPMLAPFLQNPRWPWKWEWDAADKHVKGSLPIFASGLRRPYIRQCFKGRKRLHRGILLFTRQLNFLFFGFFSTSKETMGVSKDQTWTTTSEDKLGASEAP